MAVEVRVVQDGLWLGCRACDVGSSIPVEEPTVFDRLNDFLARHRPCQRLG